MGIETADGTNLVAGDVSGTSGQEITLRVFDLSARDPTVDLLESSGSPLTLNVATGGPNAVAIVPAALSTASPGCRGK